MENDDHGGERALFAKDICILNLNTSNLTTFNQKYDWKHSSSKHRLLNRWRNSKFGFLL